MADYVEKWGDDVESAIELALKDLKLTRDEIEYTVLEEPSKGFLGLFNKKLAKVRVQKKVENSDKSSVASVSESNFEVSSNKDTDSNIDAIKSENVISSDVSSLKKEYGSKAENGIKKTDSVMNTKFTVSNEDEGVRDGSEEPAVSFINKISQDMGLNIDIEASILDDILYINLIGKEVGTMIGKRGQTLDALQYLSNIVENKKRDEHIRVVINAENYREKREKTLQQLANRLADKCISSGRNVRLEPMNPYERKVIHSTLQKNSKVNTRSEGIEPNRRVIIENIRGNRRKG